MIRTEDLILDSTKMSFEDFFKTNAIMFFGRLTSNLYTLNGLRMDLLPNTAKNILVRWIFEVNRNRLEKGLPLMVTYDIVKRCPLWTIIKMPYVRFKVSKKETAKINHMYSSARTKIDFQGIK